MAQLWIGLVLVAAGSWLATPPIVLLGLVLALAEGIRQIWARWGLHDVEYMRRLPKSSGVVGDAVPVDITVWNRKALPLAWLLAKDEASPEVVVRERDPARTRAGSSLLNTWTLAPFERVTRHFHLVAERRGIYALGPVQLEVGDLFARTAAVATGSQVDRWLVRPRRVRVAFSESDAQWGGERRARRGPVADPTRYAGVRPYQPGDPLRSIHWRATSRLGSPVSRLFDPGRHQEVAVVLDLQTVEGAGWAMRYDDDHVESLCVASASLVHWFRANGAAVGLAATGYAGATRPFAFVPPGASNGQVGRCLDLLARLGSLPSAPVERLLTTIPRALRPGTSIVVLSVRNPAPFAAALRRLTAAGHPARFVALGPDAPRFAAQARASGIDARVGHLDGPWRTATTLVVG